MYSPYYIIKKIINYSKNDREKRNKTKFNKAITKFALWKERKKNQNKRHHIENEINFNENKFNFHKQTIKKYLTKEKIYFKRIIKIKTRHNFMFRGDWNCAKAKRKKKHSSANTAAIHDFKNWVRLNVPFRV